MKRRKFIGTSAATLGGMTVFPSFAYQFLSETGLQIHSAMNTKIRVRIINTGVIHDSAWEGSCRPSYSDGFTKEYDLNMYEKNLDKIKKQIKTIEIPEEVEMLDPVSLFSYADKGNPDIYLPKDKLELLRPLDHKTDIYVVTHPFEGIKIAEKYQKPVIIMQPAGWAVDLPAAVRKIGIPGYHVNNYNELFRMTRIFMTRKAIQETKLLNITNFPNRVPWGEVSGITDFDVLKQKYGLETQFMDYDTFFGNMDKIGKENKIINNAGKYADKLIKNAGNNNMKKDDIIKSLLFYYATMYNMSIYNCNAFTIECFELCTSLEPWNRRFTPCFTHALLKDTGFPSACEGDINALMAMMVEMYLSKKAVYMGNPTIDKEKSILNIHHSVASLNMKGLDAQSTSYDIHSFTKSGFGTTLRHDFNKDKGEKVTVARFDPTASKILISNGEIIGGGGMEGIGCAQNVDIQLPNGYEFWRESQNFGHHLAMVYGDYTENIRDLGDLMGFDVINMS